MTGSGSTLKKIGSFHLKLRLTKSWVRFQNFSECQFFEHDIAENGNKYLVECPDKDEKCCFSLREHMSIEFWGRKY